MLVDKQNSIWIRQNRAKSSKYIYVILDNTVTGYNAHNTIISVDARPH